MIAPATLKRAVVALWCLAAAAGCAKVMEEAATGAAAAREPAAVPEPAAPPLPAADLGKPDPAPPAPSASIADARQEPAAPPSTTVEPKRPAPAAPTLQAKRPPPSASTVELPRSEPEPAVAAPAAPAAQEPERELDLVGSAASALSDDIPDLASLAKRLRKTKAISLRTKLAVKKESEELLEGFRAYHSEHGAATLAELRRSYDSLFRKLYSLLEDADPPLARDIDRSRAEIWAILADPIRFAAS